jgi:hypothetical protein
LNCREYTRLQALQAWAPITAFYVVRSLICSTKQFFLR